MNGGAGFRKIGFSDEKRTHAGWDLGRGQYGLTSSFQKAVNQNDPGQATRKKKKGKSREPQLALQNIIPY